MDRTRYYKAEYKETQILNRVLTRNWILKHFSPFPTHCTSLSISRDSQSTEIRINHYKTTNYTHFFEKQTDYILAQKPRFSARNQPILAMKKRDFRFYLVLFYSFFSLDYAISPSQLHFSAFCADFSA